MAQNKKNQNLFELIRRKPTEARSIEQKAEDEKFLEQINKLIKKGADVNAKDEHGFTPLHYAADGGLLETMKILLNNGAKIEAINNIGETPLHRAVSSENVDAADLLCEKGANIYATDRSGQSPVSISKRVGKEIEEFLTSKVNQDKKNNQNNRVDFFVYYHTGKEYVYEGSSNNQCNRFLDKIRQKISHNFRGQENGTKVEFEKDEACYSTENDEFVEAISTELIQAPDPKDETQQNFPITTKTILSDGRTVVSQTKDLDGLFFQSFILPKGLNLSDKEMLSLPFITAKDHSELLEEIKKHNFEPMSSSDLKLDRTKQNFNNGPIPKNVSPSPAIKSAQENVVHNDTPPKPKVQPNAQPKQPEKPAVRQPNAVHIDGQTAQTNPQPIRSWTEKLSLTRAPKDIQCDTKNGVATLPPINLQKANAAFAEDDPVLEQQITLLDGEKHGNTLINVKKGDNMVASFKEVEGKVVLSLDNGFVKAFNAQNPGILPAGTEKDDRVEFPIDHMKLSSSLNIEDIRIQGASTDMAVMFSALGCQVKNDKNQIGVVRNGDRPYDMEVSSKFLEMAEVLERGSKESSAISIERSSATDQLYVAQTKYERETKGHTKDVLSIELSHNGESTTQLLSFPKQTEDSYINFRRDNGKLYVYTQLVPQGEKSPATIYKYEQVTGISFQGTYAGGIPTENNLQQLSVVFNLSNGKSIIAETFDMKTADGKTAAQKAVAQYQDIFDEQITAATKTPEAQSAADNTVLLENFVNGKPLTIYPANNLTLYEAKFDDVAQLNRSSSESSAFVAQARAPQPAPQPAPEPTEEQPITEQPIHYANDNPYVVNMPGSQPEQPDPQSAPTAQPEQLATEQNMIDQSASERPVFDQPFAEQNDAGQPAMDQPTAQEENPSADEERQGNLKKVEIPQKPEWKKYKPSEASDVARNFLAFGSAFLIGLGLIDPFIFFAGAALFGGLAMQQTRFIQNTVFRFANYMKNVRAQRKWRKEVNKVFNKENQFRKKNIKTAYDEQVKSLKQEKKEQKATKKEAIQAYKNRLAERDEKLKAYVELEKEIVRQKAVNGAANQNTINQYNEAKQDYNKFIEEKFNPAIKEMKAAKKNFKQTSKALEKEKEAQKLSRENLKIERKSGKKEAFESYVWEDPFKGLGATNTNSTSAPEHTERVPLGTTPPQRNNSNASAGRVK